jgi:glycosyltransferase involved in cell wall biosynthesis
MTYNVQANTHGNMKRIVLITPMLQLYRLTFYDKLSRYDPDLEWIILHGVQPAEDGKLAYKGATDFQNQGFRLFKYPVGPFIIRYNKGLFSAVKRLNPDLVILQSVSGNISNRSVVNWAKRKKIPIVFWTCGWEPGIAKGFLLKFKNVLASLFFRKADFHLTYSNVASRYTEKMGVDPSIIQTCYNGIEIDPMLAHESEIIKGSAAIRQKHNLENHLSFLYVGGLLPQKKLDLLIDAFCVLQNKYPAIRLLIIGDGPLRADLLRKLEAINNDKISFLGRIVDDSDLYFAATDCLVMPGTGGLALNQAMFWRKICIVGEADGTEDDLIIDGKTGFRFEKDNLSSLTAAMERRINISQEEAAVMAEAARDIILKKSNVNNMVEVFMSTVKNLLHDKPTFVEK